jgi:hypothetical protein
VLLACGSETDAFSRCEDADCRVFTVVQAFDGTTESVVPLLLRLEDPAELTVAMNRLREADPERMGQVCELLPEGHARRRCHRVHSRPHLEGESRANLDVVKLDMASGGPRTRGVLRRSRSRYSWVTPMKTDCGSGLELGKCVTRKARALVREGQGDRAAALCADLPRGGIRDGCMARLGTAQGSLMGGLDFCLAAGGRAWSCLGELIDGLVGSQADFAKLTEAVQGVHVSLEARDAGLAGLVVERIWARALGGAYSNTVEGPPLVGLPLEALPHQRSAAARLLVQRDGPGGLGLADQVERLVAFLEEVGPAGPALGIGPVEDLWKRDAEGEASREARLYLDGSRRGVSSDLRGDLAICVLEAAARLEPADRAVLQEGLTHSDAMVQWTATRLLSNLDGTRGEPDAPWGPDHWSELPEDRPGTHKDDPNYGKNPAVPGVP